MAGKYGYKEVNERTKPTTGRWVRLKNDGDSIEVMLVADRDDPELGAVLWPRHEWLPAEKQYAPCGKLNDRDAACERCTKGERQDWRVSMTVFDVEMGDRRILDAFPSLWFGDLLDVIGKLKKRGSDPFAMIFDITRKGEKAKTRRLITPMGEAPKDLKKQVAALEPFKPGEMVRGLDGGEYDIGSGPPVPDFDDSEEPPPVEEPF